MVAPAVKGIDLFKIAGRSISGWVPSLKTGTVVRQPEWQPARRTPSSMARIPSSGEELRSWWHWSSVCDDLSTADPETRAIRDWLHVRGPTPRVSARLCI